MKLSIIVPIYNVSQYLRKCVDSLLAQDLAATDYEIILVDDGSTDDSGQIADEYAVQWGQEPRIKNQEHIRVIHQANAGLSAARNAGMAVATGDYIMFVDSDDYLEPNVLGALVQKMTDDNLNVLRYNYQNVNENYEVYYPYKHVNPYIDYRDEVCDGLTFLTERLGYACYAVMFIIRRDLLEKTLFTTGIYFEDTEWTPRMLVQAKRVTAVDTVVYNYLIRKGSITQAIDSKKKEKLLHDKLLLIRSMQKQAAEQTDKRWYAGMIAHTIVSIMGMLMDVPAVKRNEVLGKLRELQVYPLSYYQSTKAVKRKLQLMNFSPALYCWLLRIKNR